MCMSAHCGALWLLFMESLYWVCLDITVHGHIFLSFQKCILGVLAIVPLTYYIGMAITRYLFTYLYILQHYSWQLVILKTIAWKKGLLMPNQWRIYCRSMKLGTCLLRIRKGHAWPTYEVNITAKILKYVCHFHSDVFFSRYVYVLCIRFHIVGLYVRSEVKVTLREIIWK